MLSDFCKFSLFFCISSVNEETPSKEIKIFAKSLKKLDFSILLFLKMLDPDP